MPRAAPAPETRLPGQAATRSAFAGRWGLLIMHSPNSRTGPGFWGAATCGGRAGRRGGTQGEKKVVTERENASERASERGKGGGERSAAATATFKSSSLSRLQVGTNSTSTPAHESPSTPPNPCSRMAHRGGRCKAIPEPRGAGDARACPGPANTPVASASACASGRRRSLLPAGREATGQLTQCPATQHTAAARCRVRVLTARAPRGTWWR